MRWMALLGIVTLLPTARVHAQATALIQNIAGCNFTTGVIHANCIPLFIAHLIQFFFGASGAFCLLMIVVSGFQIALAKVLGKDRNEGLSRLRTALLGFILSALSWYILDFIISSLAGL
jgi:hypothetical protein